MGRGTSREEPSAAHVQELKRVGDNAREIIRDAMLLAERYKEALEKIAAPKRPDGTYNLSREACEEIAREALRRGYT